MADPLSYQLTFGGVPFFTDDARSPSSMVKRHEGADVHGAQKQRPLEYLTDELDRRLPFRHHHEFRLPSPYPGKALGQLATQDSVGPNPASDVHIGEWYYPTSASRWSVFRGLATSSMVKAMLAATGGVSPAAFVMKAVPDAPAGNHTDLDQYELTSSMYMLPNPPLAETGGDLDGVFLVTLVDERFLFQNTPVTLRVDSTTTWDDLIADLADVMGITVTYTAIDSAYGRPEPDSGLWCNAESAPLLLDAVAYNVGRIVVRALDGTYSLVTPEEAAETVDDNRGDAVHVVRGAGGDLFSTLTELPAGDLSPGRNAVVPATVTVTFPKYVNAADPVPHFLDPRYGNEQTSWHQDGHGEVYSVTVPIASGGPFVSGLTGVSTSVVHSTAKALYASEAAAGGDPTNVTSLTTLATRVARDYYGWLAGRALNESYHGTYAWEPEGFHDVVWSYSDRQRGATCRLVRQEWNQLVRDMQHATPGATVSGHGGHAVAQTWQQQSGTPGAPSAAFRVNLVSVGSGLRFTPGVTTEGISEAVLEIVQVSGGGTPTLGSGVIQSGMLASGSVNSGALSSGIINWWNFGTCMSGILCSGSVHWFHLGSGSIQSGHLVSGLLAAAGDGWVLAKTITHADLTTSGTDRETVSGVTLPARTPLYDVMIRTRNPGFDPTIGITQLDLYSVVDGGNISGANVIKTDGLVSGNIGHQAHWTDFVSGRRVVGSWSSGRQVDVAFFTQASVNFIDMTSGEWELWLHYGPPVA